MDRVGILAACDRELLLGERETIDLVQAVNRPRFRTGEPHRLRLLFEAGTWSEAQRTQVAEALLEAWPSESRRRALEEMLAIVEGLEAIGRSDLLERKREDVERTLRRRWTGAASGHAEPATFLPPGEHNDRLRHAAWSAKYADTALQLMLRFGVPEGIDIERFAFWLEEGAISRRLHLLFREPDRLEPHLFASEYYLLRAFLEDQGITLPSRSLARVPLADPVLLGALLFVALCLYATISARRAERRRERETGRDGARNAVGTAADTPG